MQLSRVRFLVVDDNHFMRSILMQVLHAFGATEICEAENGREAMASLKDFRPDIALVDWEMEPVNGLELVRWIRNAPGSPNRFIPIIMVSAHSELRRVAMARDAGVTEFVVKPASARVLWHRIRAVVERPRRFIRTKSYFGPDRRRQEVDTGHEDRRTRKAAPEGVVVFGNEPMTQDAINAFFNPQEGAKPSE